MSVSLSLLAVAFWRDAEITTTLRQRQQNRRSGPEKLAALAETGRQPELRKLTSLQELIDERFISDVTVRRGRQLHASTLVTSTGAVSTIRITNGRTALPRRSASSKNLGFRRQILLDPRQQAYPRRQQREAPVAGERTTAAAVQDRTGATGMSPTTRAPAGGSAARPQPMPDRLCSNPVTTSEDGKLVYHPQDGTVLTFETLRAVRHRLRDDDRCPSGRQERFSSLPTLARPARGTRRSRPSPA